MSLADAPVRLRDYGQLRPRVQLAGLVSSCCLVSGTGLAIFTAEALWLVATTGSQLTRYTLIGGVMTATVLLLGLWLLATVDEALREVNN
jgi:F0F1-type ATP synthase membrane subunit c/vacuolar-type H+-ATPase subunit K